MINTLLLTIKGVNSTLTFFEKIVFALQKRAERPSGYGWFHLLCFFLVILTTVMLCVFFRKISERKFKTIIFIFWIVMVLFEVYKQIVYSFSVDGALCRGCRLLLSGRRVLNRFTWRANSNDGSSRKSNYNRHLCCSLL